MKQKTILRYGGIIALVVILLGVSAIAMPASAARMVANGGTVFDYEQGLDLSSFVMNGDCLAKYVDDDPMKGQIFSIPVPNAAAFDLTMIDLQGNYGTYYTVSNTFNKVYIRNPTVAFDAVLEADITSSIAGKTVTRNTPIAFRFDATEVGTYLAGANTATVNVEIVTPGGGTIREVVDAAGVVQNFMGLQLNAPRTYYRNIDISQLEDGTYTAKAVWAAPAGFANYATDSAAVTFTLSTIETEIEANKERLVRGNPFVISIAGDAKIRYNLYIKDAGIVSDAYPSISPGQPGIITVDFAFSTGDPVADALANNERAYATGAYVPGTAATVVTDADGVRPVEFATYGNTGVITYTIKIINTADASITDSVQVTVEEGDITIATGGAGPYYIGDEIELTGINTDSDMVYLFMTGPSLGTDLNGVELDNLCLDASAGNYVARAVESDDTWEYHWNIAALAGTGPMILGAGTYTIYAASNRFDESGANIDAAHLQGVCYASTSFELGDPTLTTKLSGIKVARGDRLIIDGVATGSPDVVQIWLLGENYRLMGNMATVGDDGVYTFYLDRADTANLATGNYTTIVQHPMKNGMFDVFSLYQPSPYCIGNSWSVDIVNLGALSAADAVAAIVEMLNSPNCDDIHVDSVFTLEDPWILIDEIGDRPVGDHFFISGTTNLAEGNMLIIDVAGTTSSVSGTTEVVRGEDGVNTWSYYVDTSSLSPDTLSVRVESMAIHVQQNAFFNLIGSAPCALSVIPENSTVAVGGTYKLSVVLDRASQGLSGFEVTIDLTNTSNAEITKVELPSWAGLSTVGGLPADTLTIRAADLNNRITPGGSEITLCTLSVRGDAAGSTGIRISSATIDSDRATRYGPVMEDGLLEVIAIHPFHRPEGGTYPLPTDKDGDGMYEDLDGNGFIGFNDVVLYFGEMSFIEKAQPIGAFDYDLSGFIGFNDVVELFRLI